MRARCPPVLDLALIRVQELGEHPRERVDLMSAEFGLTGRELRARLDQYALEAEHQPELDLPGVRRSAQLVPDLTQRLVECAPSGGPRREHLLGILVGVQERFARRVLGLARCCSELLARQRRINEVIGRRCHGGSARLRWSFHHKVRPGPDPDSGDARHSIDESVDVLGARSG